MSPRGTFARAYGLRAGYWPCLGAPFVRIDFDTFIIEFWIGGPSYLPPASPHERGRA